MSTPEEQGVPLNGFGRPTTPGLARRSASKVEFMLTPSDEDVNSGSRATTEDQHRHDWRPGRVPVISSLLVRTSLTPDATALPLDDAENSGRFSGEPGISTGWKVSSRRESPHIAAAAGHRSPTRQQHQPPSPRPPGELGTSISVSSGQGSLPTRFSPPATGLANSPSVVDAFPFAPMDGETPGATERTADRSQKTSPDDEERPGSAQHRTSPTRVSMSAASLPSAANGGGGGGIGTANHNPLCMATGKRPSFVEGVSPHSARGSLTPGAGLSPRTDSVIGAERDDVFVDHGGDGMETIPLHMAPDSDDDEEESHSIAEKKKRRTKSTSKVTGVPPAGTVGETHTTTAKRPSSGSAKPKASHAMTKRASVSPSAKGRPSRAGSRSSSVTPPRGGRSASAGKSSTSGTGGSSSGGERQRSPGGATRSRRSVTPGKAGATGRRVSSGPSATEKALRSINFAAFTGSNVKPKAKRARMMNEFTAAHQRGAADIAAEWKADITAMHQQFVEASFEPHRRELLRLVDYVRVLRKDCKEKLEFAAATCNATLEGVESLLERLHDAGLDLANSTEVLAFLDQSTPTISLPSPNKDSKASGVTPSAATSPPSWRQPSAPREKRDAEGDILGQGHVMPEIEDGDAAWREAELHPSVRLIPREEMERGAAIKRFFTGPLEMLRKEAVELSLPPNIGEMTAPNTGLLIRLKAEEAKHQAARAAEAQSLKERLAVLTDVTVGLMTRLQTQDETQRSQIRGLQRALDEGCTRQKLADDVLNGCLSQQSQESAYGFAHVKHLEMELRTRMDAIEADVRNALDDLIAESAAVSLGEGSAVGINGSSNLRQYSKQNCVKVFSTRTEQAAREQAAVLREAQESMQRLWQSSSEYLPGREEKRTLLYRAFPQAYEALLQRCDRDTLLRLIHHLSLQSEDMTRCLMSALQEYEKFLDSNVAEAVAFKEREDTRMATMALLEKIYEEHGLYDRPQLCLTVDGKLTSTEQANAGSTTGTTTASITSTTARPQRAPLSEIVGNMTRRYNEMMQFDETYARALVQQREELEKALQPEWRPAFFDERVAVPAPFAQPKPSNQASSGSLATKTAPPSRGVRPEATRSGLPVLEPQRPADAAVATAPGGALATLFSTRRSSGTAASAETVPMGKAVAFLQRANPSLLRRVESTHGEAAQGACLSVASTTRNMVSVVGEGRWSGRAPVRATGLAGTYPSGTPAASTRSAHDFASLTTISHSRKGIEETSPSVLPSVNASGNGHASPPPPALPLRDTLVTHVMSSYNHTREQLMGSPPGTRGLAADRIGTDATGGVSAAGEAPELVPLPPPRAKRAYDNHDLPFLQRQRQVLEPLLGMKPAAEPDTAINPRFTATI